MPSPSGLQGIFRTTRPQAGDREDPCKASLPEPCRGHRLGSSQPKQQRKTTMTQQPFSKIKDGLLSATIWQNRGEDNKIRYSITLTRNYKDDAGQWQETNQFSPMELLKINHLANRAYEVIRAARNDFEN